MKHLFNLQIKNDWACRLNAYRLVLFICVFCCCFRISEHQHENNMDSRNLSRCWWPTIMRMEFASYETMLQFSGFPEDIVLTLIQQCNFFFFGGNEI